MANVLYSMYQQITISSQLVKVGEIYKYVIVNFQNTVSFAY